MLRVSHTVSLSLRNREIVSTQVAVMRPGPLCVAKTDWIGTKYPSFIDFIK